MIIVARTDPHEATALLRESHALMQSLFAPEDNFYLEIDDLVAPDIHFFTARVGDDMLGTAALKMMPEYGEVKSMYVADAGRGQGVGAALLRQVEDCARAEGATLLKLETGNVLYAAHRLYARHGFIECNAFGNYAAAQSSVFMEKAL